MILNNPATTMGVMERLKTTTQPLHDAAEHHPVQRALFKGRLPKDGYVAMLGQLFLAHRALEEALRALVLQRPELKSIVKPWQHQEPYLREDLAFFGVDCEAIKPLPATTALVKAIERAQREAPMAILGMHYVVEGSNNGSKFSAMAVRKAYGLDAGKGDRYLDPYGDAQREHWASFKAAMNASEFSSTDIDALLFGAGVMFDGIARMSDDLLHYVSTSEPASA